MNLGKAFYEEYFNKISINETGIAPVITKEEENGREITVNQFKEYLKKIFSANIDSYRQFIPEIANTNASFQLTTTYPGLLIGSGYNHLLPDLEGQLSLGFYFDYTTGLPCLPGSSIKGVLRHACEAVNGHYVASLLEDIKENGEEDIKIAATKYLEKQETDLHIKGQNKTSLFVTQVFEGKKEVSGELENIAPNLRDIFFDAFPVEVNNKQQQLLGDDFITPHHPDDPVTGQFKNPIPICFLKIMPKVVFQFNFKLGDEGMDKALKKELFRQIILDQGIGAKTNVGYGNFTTDNGQGNN